MGFSIGCSLGSHVWVRNTGKFPPLCRKERLNLSTMCSEFNKPCKIRVSLCKSELVDFDERTSPTESLVVPFFDNHDPRNTSTGHFKLSEDVSFIAAIEVHVGSAVAVSVQIRKEIGRCYELIHRLGRGVVYLGSSRMGPDHPHYSQALELGREVANLLDCTSWTGAGPGLMDAATKGALEAGKPVGGFKIAKEAGEWTASNFHSYLPSETYLTCRFFSARKHGLVDAAVRSSCSDRTAVVALPGGIGTLDEMFEILTLIQLQRIGSELPVPFLVMNYDSYYQKLLDFLGDCENWGTVSKGEVASLWKICENNSEALAYLADFYGLPSSGEERHELRKGLQDFGENYLKKLGKDKASMAICESFQEAASMLPEGNVDFYLSTSFCRLPFYGIDFGWGKPTWVTIPAGDYKNVVSIMDAKDGKGIEAWVTLTEDDMAFFERDRELLAAASFDSVASDLIMPMSSL
ncbi:hypothetical protein NC652_021904 [Populus alba x Populus x berolinensis]|nr:hypothetical protein NC652_021904 [Populus alba x Populus x berolinensis]